MCVIFWEFLVKCIKALRCFFFMMGIINQDNLEELISTDGKIKKAITNFFAEYYKKEQEKREEFLSALNLKNSGSQSLIEFADENGFLQSMVSDNLEVLPKNISRERAHSSLYMSNTLPQSEKENISHNLEFKNIVDPVLPLPNSSVEDLSFEPNPKRKRISSQETEESAEIIADDTRVYRENEITETLEKSIKGRAVIEYYKLYDFDNPIIILLAEVIVEDEYKSNTNTVISCVRFSELAKLIADAFPGEISQTYYISSSSRGKGKSASGKLYDQYANFNRILRKVKLREIRPGKRDTVFELSNAQGDYPIIPEDTISETEIQKDLLFLKTYTQPWGIVKEKWSNTCAYRMNDLRNCSNEDLHKKCSEYLSLYPAISQVHGHLLLESDFDALYKNASNRVLERWSDFSKKLKSELSNQKSNLEHRTLNCSPHLRNYS
ncbi:uncharacterized protein LOC122499514 [Leptopilina heterotoma]|uniref:uncharacterized protein LOC122499514 n=1 Tax=Leptopilina heterotoma TaxID=63436 RepID=UPI001CA88FD4|nr:uncharacterized protein LOC122499514 [Leptopilina heterotoma]